MNDTLSPQGVFVTCHNEHISLNPYLFLKQSRECLLSLVWQMFKIAKKINKRKQTVCCLLNYWKLQHWGGYEKQTKFLLNNSTILV